MLIAIKTEAIKEGAAVSIGMPHLVNPSTVAKDNAAETPNAAKGIKSNRNDATNRPKIAIAIGNTMESMVSKS